MTRFTREELDKTTAQAFCHCNSGNCGKLCIKLCVAPEK